MIEQGRGGGGGGDEKGEREKERKREREKEKKRKGRKRKERKGGVSYFYFLFFYTLIFIKHEINWFGIKTKRIFRNSGFQQQRLSFFFSFNVEKKMTTYLRTYLNDLSWFFFCVVCCLTACNLTWVGIGIGILYACMYVHQVLPTDVPNLPRYLPKISKYLGTLLFLLPSPSPGGR